MRGRMGEGWERGRGEGLVGGGARTAQQILRVFMETGGDVNIQDRQGWSALHMVSFLSFPGGDACLDLLLSARADVCSKTQQGLTPLHLAAADGRVSTASKLLAHGAKGDARGAGGETPLHVAAKNGHDGMVSLLIRMGASMRMACDEGRTGLHHAVTSGHLPTVAAVYQASPDMLRAKDSNGRTAEDLARELYYEDIISFLSECSLKDVARSSQNKPRDDRQGRLSSKPTPHTPDSPYMPQQDSAKVRQMAPTLSPLTGGVGDDDRLDLGTPASSPVLAHVFADVEALPRRQVFAVDAKASSTSPFSASRSEDVRAPAPSEPRLSRRAPERNDPPPSTRAALYQEPTAAVVNFNDSRGAQDIFVGGEMEWERLLPCSDIEFGQLLGSGTFGDVYKAKWLGSGSLWNSEASPVKA
eukprot:750113-Hanusia_phi.AAC.7